MTEAEELQQEIRSRLAALPKVVRDAITSTDVQERLRKLATVHKLHLDQWEAFENEVMFTLLGIQPIEELERNIKQELGVTDEIARTLTSSASELVFEPIRQELERQLEHPAAQEKEVSEIEEARAQQLGENTAASPITISPATPPLPPSSIKVARPSESSSYKPGEPSSTRAVVHDDPYRVPPV